MYTDPWIVNFWMPGSLLFWSLAYLLIMRRGFLDKSYGMPLVPLCGNFAWEFVFGFLYPDAEPMGLINRLWFFLDIVLVYQFLRYGFSDYPKNLSKKLKIPVFLVTLGVAFGLIYFAYHEFDDFDGRYTAWVDNLIISVMFIVMLVRRGSLMGQSLYIGIFKMLGTLFIDVAQHQLTPSDFLFFLYIVVFFFDVVYLVMFCQKARELGVNPWKRP